MLEQLFYYKISEEVLDIFHKMMNHLKISMKIEFFRYEKHKRLLKTKEKKEFHVEFTSCKFKIKDKIYEGLGNNSHIAKSNLFYFIYFFYFFRK